MRTAVLLACLLGPAWATPTHPLNDRFETHGQKAAEKAQYVHSETPEEENTGPVHKGDLLPSRRAARTEAPAPEARRGEPWAARRTGRGGREQIKASLRSINFLSLPSHPGLASDSWDSDPSSSREGPSSERSQLERQQEQGGRAWLRAAEGEHPADALRPVRERNTWKYNKNAVGLPELSSESEEEEGVEEEDEEWGEETDYRDMKHGAHQTSRGNRYKRQQNENARTSDGTLRESSQPARIAKRHSEKSVTEQGEREDSQEKPSKEGKTLLAVKHPNEDQDEKRPNQDSKENFQVNNESGHGTVTERQDKEGSNAEEDDIDSGDDGEEGLSHAWKEAAYEEEERMQSNAQESTGSEQEGEGTAEDDSAVYRESQDRPGVKAEGTAHPEGGHGHHEAPNSDRTRQLPTSSSAESMNSLEVNSTGSSHPEPATASSSAGKALLDPCRNFHCKRGRVCQAGEQGKPSCICQDPAACPSAKDYERVCGTDNKTYDGTCQLFGTKCQLEGTKIGHQLHLDYMGACKYIPHCSDYEVDQFPLRMRDWLKNILMQHYERDQDTSGFLTEKQRNKVKKIYQNEQRLAAGQHSVELLLHDFEKNYRMYVYPVHWQFYQLDQHPADRSLTHSELAPLRASLVPMEHCITRFFQECDGDRDRLVTLKEWCHCFEIKDEDVNESLLF